MDALPRPGMEAKTVSNLVLSRRVQEGIVIGDNIEVVVTEIHDNCVKLAIQAPRNIPIYRHELLGRRVRRPEDPSVVPI